MMARPGVPTLTFLLVVATLAAGPTVVWYKDYGFNEGGKVYDAAPLDGGVVVVGYACPTTTCFYTARINPNGEVVWERAWKHRDRAQLMAVCTLNGMIVAVGYSGPWNGPLRPYVCVLNGSGLLVRETYLNSLTNFKPAGIDALEDHIVICGEAGGVPAIVVMNANLRVLWSKRLPHRGSLEAVVAEEDGIYVAGSVSGTPTGAARTWPSSTGRGCWSGRTSCLTTGACSTGWTLRVTCWWPWARYTITRTSR